MDFNTCIISGHVGNISEPKAMSSGKTVLNFSVGVNRFWKNKAGEQQKETTWVKVACFEGLADTMVRYLEVGGYVIVNGSLRLETVDKNGEKVTYTSIAAKDIHMVPKGDKATRGAAAKPANKPAQQPSLGYPTAFDIDPDLASDDPPGL